MSIMQLRYVRYLQEKIRRGEFKWIINNSFKYPAIALSRLLHRPLCGPIIAGLLLTYRCNLKCLFCDYWNRHVKEKRPELSTAEFKDVIDDFFRIGASGIGFMGGEPLLRKDLSELIRYASGKGMTTATTTNGYLLNDENLEAVMHSGLEMLTVSIDGTNAEIHDKIRGVQGSFQKAVDAVRKIDQYRKKNNISIMLGVSTCINLQNIDYILNMPDFVKSLGVDHNNFMGIETMGLVDRATMRKKSVEFNKDDASKFDKVIDGLAAYKKKYGFIDNSFGGLELMKKQFRNEFLPITCYAGNTTYYVDCYGDIYPCLAYMEMCKAINNMHSISAKDFWYSKEYQRVRDKLYKCRLCYFPCQNEFNVLYSLKYMLSPMHN